MHPVYPALLALAPLAAAETPLSEGISICIRAHSVRIIDGPISCAEAAPFTECLDSLGELFSAPDFESCLVASGCPEDLAATGASTFIHFCESIQESTGDLQKRQRGGSNNDDDDENKEDEPSNKKQPALPAAPAPATPVPAQTEAPAAETNPDATTPAPPAKGRVTAMAQSNKGPTGTECYTTKTQVKDVCTMDENRKHVCKPVNILKPHCRDGYLCRMGRQGDTACMERVDNLDVGGIIISIVFGSAIVVAIGLMTFFSCRDKKRQKTLAAKLEAAAIAKASNVGKKARNVSDRQPLMAQGPPGGPSSAGPPPSAYGADPQQPNPFTDQSRY